MDTRIFFLIWVCWNLLRNFSGSRRPIFKCFDIIRFVFPLAFQRHIRNCSIAKTCPSTTKTKQKVENDGKGYVWANPNHEEKQSWFGFSQTFYKIFRAVVSRFFFIDIIRIVLPLAFQSHILNCSTAKNCDVTVKIVREVENYEQKLLLYPPTKGVKRKCSKFILTIVSGMQ